MQWNTHKYWFFLIFNLCVWYMHVHLCALACVCGGQKRGLDHLELELQPAVSWLCVIGAELWFSIRTANTLNYRAISLAWLTLLLWRRVSHWTWNSLIWPNWSINQSLAPPSALGFQIWAVTLRFYMGPLNPSSGSPIFSASMLFPEPSPQPHFLGTNLNRFSVLSKGFVFFSSPTHSPCLA